MADFEAAVLELYAAIIEKRRCDAYRYPPPGVNAEDRAEYARLHKNANAFLVDAARNLLLAIVAEVRK